MARGSKAINQHTIEGPREPVGHVEPANVVPLGVVEPDAEEVAEVECARVVAGERGR